MYKCNLCGKTYDESPESSLTGKFIEHLERCHFPELTEFCGYVVDVEKDGVSVANRFFKSVSKTERWIK